MRNVKLKAAIFEAGLTQNELAERAKIPRTYLSQAITGRLNLTEAEQTRIAEELKRSRSELFGTAA